MYLLIRFHRACQDLSKAGLGKGMEKGSGTRSGMLWEVERILDECEELPQVLLMENVPDVIGTKNIKHFSNWLEKLESLGYKCFWQVLNGKDYGVPQNRERCFMVSILGDYCYEFPEPIKLEKRLKDLLEDEVDEKFYLSDRAISGIQNTTFNCSTLEARTEKDGVMPTLCARDYKDPKLVVEEPKCVQVAQLEGGFESTGRVYSPDGISPTITTCGGGNREPKVMLDNEPRVLAGIGEKKSNGGTQWYQQDRIYDDNIAISVTTSFNPYYAVEKKENLGYIEKNILKAIQKNDNKMPAYIDIYNSRPINDEVSSTLTTNSSFTQCGITLVCEQNKKENHGIVTATNVLKSNNKRLKQLVGKMDLSKDNQFMDIYNQTTSEDAGTITTRVDASNSTAVYKDYRIRKLTPKECFRLMSVRDCDFERIAKNQSNASLYHLAGDSIITLTLCAIFAKMFPKSTKKLEQVLHDFYSQIERKEV